MNIQKSVAQDLSYCLNESWLPLTVDLGAATHQGHVRPNNEDSYLTIRFGRSLERLSTTLDEQLIESNYDVVGYGMMVADGMGGMAAGEVASHLAIKNLVELILDTPDWVLLLRRTRDIQTVFQRMQQRFYQVDRLLKDETLSDATLRGMGTTLTVAGALGNDLVIGHIGDSRAYLLRTNSLAQLTRDHTLAQALSDAGLNNPDDPATRSMRHVLTAAIGGLDDSVEPQVQRFKLSAGDQLLLCTDGLTDMVSEDLIAAALKSAGSAQNACNALVDLALAGGGLDNITVVLARFAEE